MADDKPFTCGYNIKEEKQQKRLLIYVLQSLDTKMQQELSIFCLNTLLPKENSLQQQM
jgi:hypothetical protein